MIIDSYYHFLKRSKYRRDFSHDINGNFLLISRKVIKKNNYNYNNYNYL